MEENKTEEKTWQEEICEQVENQIKTIKDQQVQQGNVDYLYKLVDIHKDLANEKYWKSKEEKMYRESMREPYGTYGAYDNYMGGRRRDSRGRFMESGRGNYGRRYRGDEVIDEMAEHYGNYMGEKEYGRYGSPEMSKALDYMLKSVEEFMGMLKNDADSQEEVEKIRHTAEKISRM